MSSSSSSTSKPRSSGPVLRSLSPSGRLQSAFSNSGSDSPFCSPASSFASSTSSSFYSPPSSFYENDDHHHHNNHRSSSPTRVNLYSSNSLASSFRFSIDRSVSQSRHNHIVKSHSSGAIPVAKRTCMCSPTSHPGSFRCSLHKNAAASGGGASYPSNRLNMRRSAMKNSLVRIGGVEGEWVKRALTALIRPSSHHQKRREGFEPRPSRLSVMSMAET